MNRTFTLFHTCTPPVSLNGKEMILPEGHPWEVRAFYGTKGDLANRVGGGEGYTSMGLISTMMAYTAGRFHNTKNALSSVAKGASSAASKATGIDNYKFGDLTRSMIGSALSLIHI